MVMYLCGENKGKTEDPINRHDSISSINSIRKKSIDSNKNNKNVEYGDNNDSSKYKNGGNSLTDRLLDSEESVLSSSKSKQLSSFRSSLISSKKAKNALDLKKEDGCSSPEEKDGENEGGKGFLGRILDIIFSYFSLFLVAIACLSPLLNGLYEYGYYVIKKQLARFV